MRPGRRRGGRTGRPMRQGPHPADASKGAPPKGKTKGASRPKACRDACLPCATKRTIGSVARMRLSESTDDRKNRRLRSMKGFAGLRFWSPPKVVSVQFCTKQTCTKVHPGSGQKAATSVTKLVHEVAEYGGLLLAQARSKGMQVHVRPVTGRKGAKLKTQAVSSSVQSLPLLTSSEHACEGRLPAPSPSIPSNRRSANSQRDAAIASRLAPSLLVCYRPHANKTLTHPRIVLFAKMHADLSRELRPNRLAGPTKK